MLHKLYWVEMTQSEKSKRGGLFFFFSFYAQGCDGKEGCSWCSLQLLSIHPAQRIMGDWCVAGPVARWCLAFPLSFLSACVCVWKGKPQTGRYLSLNVCCKCTAGWSGPLLCAFVHVFVCVCVFCQVFKHALHFPILDLNNRKQTDYCFIPTTMFLKVW